MKFAEITPIIIALSAVKIIVMKIIWDNMSASSNKIEYLYYKILIIQSKVEIFFFIDNFTNT